MPDTRELLQIEAAANPRRFRLLEEAVLHKSFLAQDAERIATRVQTGSGTARTNHVKRLVSVGLLRRKENPVRYVPTKAGKAVYNTLRQALSNTAPTREDEAVVIVSLLEMQGDAARDAASAAVDLVALLEAELRRAPAIVKARREPRAKAR